MILLAHDRPPFKFRESSLRPASSCPPPLQKTHFLNVPMRGGGGGRSWRERITQFRHVTIPRLEKPTNFKTNGTVISTPDMTNSRPFLSCILPLLCIVASLRSIPAASPRRHRDFLLHVVVKKRTLRAGLPFILFPHPAITLHVPA